MHGRPQGEGETSSSPSVKFLRVWAKNLWIEISWENFEIYIYKSQWKIDFLSIFYPIFQDRCHFIQLWKITPFSTTFFWFQGGEASNSAGAPATHYYLNALCLCYIIFFRAIENN